VATKTLLEEYNLNCSVQKFTGRLPEFYTYELCPYCDGEPMISKGNTRDSSKNIVLNTKCYCNECGHIIDARSFKPCSCNNCEQVIVNAIDNEINSSLENAKADIDYVNEEPMVKWFLAAIMRSGQDEFDVTLIHPSFSMAHSRLTPDDNYTMQLVSALKKSNWIRFAEITNKESLTIENQQITKYQPLKATYRLNVTDNFSLLEVVSAPDVMIPDNYISLLWSDLAYQECMEYTRYLLDDYRLPNNIGPKTEATIRDGLKKYSTSQMFNHIWSSVKDAAAQAQKAGITKKHAVNMISGTIQRRIERMSTEGWEVKGYGRNYNLPQSILADLFFNRMTTIGERGFTAVPCFDMLNVSDVENESNKTSSTKIG
jgi:hypothetical protein